VAEFFIGNSLRKVAREHPLLQRLLWRVDYAVVWCITKFARLFPVDAASRFGERLGRWLGPKFKNKTAIYRENFATVFPELGPVELDDLVLRAWGQAGRLLVEYPHLDVFLADQSRLEIEIREPVETFSNPARPCVMVSAHLSNWEVVCTAMARMGIPNASLYSPPSNPLLDEMLLASRRALNCELLLRDNSARLLMRALKSGRTAGIVMDRRVKGGAPIEFFGREKPSTLLPAKLALKAGCDLVPAQVVRLQDARYKVIFHPPVRPRNPAAAPEEQALDMIQQVHILFEDWIRQHPEGWLCSKRIWPKAFKAFRTTRTSRRSTASRQSKDLRADRAKQVLQNSKADSDDTEVKGHEAGIDTNAA